LHDRIDALARHREVLDIRNLIAQQIEPTGQTLNSRFDAARDLEVELAGGSEADAGSLMTSRTATKN